VYVIRRFKTESTEVVEEVRRAVIAKQLGVELTDGPITDELIVGLLHHRPKPQDDEICLRDLFDSIDQNQYVVFTDGANLGCDERNALCDLESRLNLPIEYCQLDDGKWCIRFWLPNSVPIAGIATTLQDAAKRLEVILRLVPAWRAPSNAPTRRTPDVAAIGLTTGVSWPAKSDSSLPRMASKTVDVQP